MREPDNKAANYGSVYPTKFYDALSFHFSGYMCMTSTDEDGFKTEIRIDIPPMP